MLDDRKIYYVYVYLDQRKKGNYNYNEYCFKYEPFYVGKGKGNRCQSHLRRSTNIFLGEKIRSIMKNIKTYPLITLYEENLSEIDAYNLESNMIDTIGRLNLFNGPLLNITNCWRSIQEEETYNNYKEVIRTQLNEDDWKTIFENEKAMFIPQKLIYKDKTKGVYIDDNYYEMSNDGTWIIDNDDFYYEIDDINICDYDVILNNGEWYFNIK